MGALYAHGGFPVRSEVFFGAVFTFRPIAHILISNLQRKGNVRPMKCCKICEWGYVALPAFGIGVLTSLFLPPCVVVGISAVVCIGFGAACIAYRY